jgi:hypothetical protein
MSEKSTKPKDEDMEGGDARDVEHRGVLERVLFQARHAKQVSPFLSADWCCSLLDIQRGPSGHS